MRTEIEGFLAKVIRPDSGGCWIWNGFLEKNGYGKFSHGGRREWAHRCSYRLFVGDIPPGRELDHLCGNPSCVNPAHLEAVTHRENMKRSPHSAPDVHRAKTHCPHGHPYTGENLHVYRGMRYCRECERRHKRAYKIKQRKLKGEKHE